MKYSAVDWAIKRKGGIGPFLFFDGIIKTGGPFAVILQVVGYFLFAPETQSFGEYFSSSRTWITFFFHATLFGLIMGFINWRRNESAFAKTAVADVET